MNDIFIFHEAADRLTASEYFKALKSDNYLVCSEEFSNDNDFEKKLKSHILNSRVILFLLSQSAIKDKQFLKIIKFSRSYDKEIIFINIDSIEQKNLNKYKSYGPIYNQLSEVNINDYIGRSSLMNRYIKADKTTNKYFRHFFFSFSIMLLFTIYSFFNEIKFFNLIISKDFGYVLAIIDGLLLLSTIPSRRMFQINGLFGLIGLLVTIFFMNTYYISDVSVIPILYVGFYFLAFYIRYSKSNIIIASIFGLINTALLIIVLHTSLMFFIYLLNVDLIFLDIIVFVIFVFIQYFNNHNFFKAYSQKKLIVNDIYSLNNKEEQ